MNVQKRFSLILLSLAIGACSDESAFDGRGAFVSSDNVSMQQYAEVNRIPARAVDRRQAAYQGFMERSRIASFLLENQLSDNLPLKVQLQEATNLKVIDAYFAEFTSARLSEAKLRKYYEENTAKFSQRGYVVSRILVRSHDADGSEAVSLVANSVRKALASGESIDAILKQSEVNAGVTVVAEEGVELRAANINPRVADALISLQQGEISDIVAAARGVQLFRVDQVDERKRPYEEVAGMIEYQLKEELKQKEYQRLALQTRTR